MLFIINIFRKYGKEIFIFLFAWILLSKVSEVFGRGGIGHDSTADLDNDDLLNANEQTLTVVEVKTIANGFKNALVFEGFGDSVELIEPLFARFQNQSDFNAVYNEFGLIQYSMTWGNGGDPVTSDKHNLIEILTNELKPDDREYFKLEYPNVQVF